MDINLEKYNDRGQFKVPEGYFDTLADRIMANIPNEPAKQEKTARIISLNTRLKYAVAAGIVAAIIGGTTIHLYQQNTHIAEQINTEKTNNSATYSEEYVNDYIDYALVDANDIYEYISDN